MFEPAAAPVKLTAISSSDLFGLTHSLYEARASETFGGSAVEFPGRR